MPNHKSILKIKGHLLLVLILLTAGGYSYGYAPDYYASSSNLSSGSWAKIEVKETGMQFISDNTIKSLGFSDPEKVNVFGYGGKLISENLNSPDDLPVVASQRVNGGIIFFGRGSIGWEPLKNSEAQYSHVSHPYSDASYYFLSDCLPERYAPEKAERKPLTSDPVTVFTERIVHEQDLFMPMMSGRLILGEDFKTAKSHNFNFQLPGNTGDAIVTTSFGCKTSSGTSSLMFTANGKQLEATKTDQMAYSSSKLIVTTSTVKKVTSPGESLDLTIKFNGVGVVTTAALNYIEVEYPRQLKMNAGELYFYLSPTVATPVKIEGCNASTVVWDVTDSENPVLMPVELNGGSILFTSEPGNREYVAFDPSRIGRAVTAAGKIGNQDIHSLEAPGMLVICPSEYTPAARRLEELHKKTDGLTLAILTPEEIYNEFSSGKPDVSAFRKLLKMWYDRAEGRTGEYPAYCLIMSRPTYDNKMVSAIVKNCGYPRVPIWQSPTGETETTSYSTDDYIGMLKDVTGTFNIGSAEINTAVGRMPVKSLNEANTAMDKLEEYILKPDLGNWRSNIMVIADDQDNGVHLDQAESVISTFLEGRKAKDFIIEKLYLDSYTLESTGTGAAYPQAHQRMLNKWNEGLSYINYIGHANPKSWGHENLLTWTNITTMSNERLPFLYAATCEFMRWDEDDVSGGEVLWLLPNSGVIGMICPSREVLISANGVLNKSMAQFLFAEDDEGQPLSVGELMRRGKNSSNTGTNKLRYGIIGDPSMQLPWPKLDVNIDMVNGVELATAKDYPVVKARQNVTLSGHVADRDGNVIEDFNGIAEIVMYDAEKVITTNGNGSDGVQSTYNDRKTRLFVGRTKVTDGKWSTDFTMPSEIENNYSPAFLSIYAFEENGREANGSTEKIYAYGYDNSVPDDFEGPKIIEFYLNHANFSDGDEVSPTPILTAKFYDESGISVSEAGIGHNISLDLDGKTYFDDVAQYYLPDENDSGAGSVTYALGEIPQGDHTLRFTVWDNANNSTTATLNFSISALWKPTIHTLTTDVNPATSSVNFIVATDGATSSMECAIEVYDIWGKRVWRNSAPSITGSNSRTTLGWDLCDFGGARVPGGIYLYKAIVKTNSGATVTKTKKLVVK